MRRSLIAAVALAALAASPATALGAELTVSQPCFLEAQPMLVAGSGFAPGSRIEVKIGDSSRGFPTADPQGRFSGSIPPPPVTSRRRDQQGFTVTATDTGNPAITASTTFQVTRFGLRVTPRRARATSRVRFSASGFRIGRTVYAHYLLRGRLRATVSLGRSRGPCGTTSKRMGLVPLRNPPIGVYDVRIDSRRRYSARTKPQVRAQVSIFRRLRG